MWFTYHEVREDGFGRDMRDPCQKDQDYAAPRHHFVLARLDYWKELLLRSSALSRKKRKKKRLSRSAIEEDKMENSMT